MEFRTTSIVEILIGLGYPSVIGFRSLVMSRALFPLFLCLAAPAFAQSTVTLDSFSLDPAPQPAPEAPAAEMRDCLLNADACTSDEFGGTSAFTLDDVVNLGVVDRAQVAAAAAAPAADGDAAALAIRDRGETTPLPSIDLEILFAYNSDDLTPQAMAKLSTLSSALRDPRMANSRLVFIGHTDAVGSASYNLDLSRRRAEAVANFVQGTMQLSPSRIDAVGVGFTRLKDSFDPASAQNRRVQLVLVPGA